MPISIVRFRHENQIYWGSLQDQTLTPINTSGLKKSSNNNELTTNEFVSLGYDTIQKLIAENAQQNDVRTFDYQQVELLSPITNDSKVLCQGVNYRQHMIDSGVDPDQQNFNMFFTKSSASITGPAGKIVRPDHVELLDYEIELTLVLAKETHQAETISEDNLHEYIAGICIGNDVSARDVQIPQMQFHKGKSYRTFCPLGPILCLLNKDEMHLLNDLQLTLKVNGEIRQQDNTRNLVYKPAQTLSEYSQIANFNPGDVLMTGTPSGCALGLPSPLLVRIAALLPEKMKWSLFLSKQKQRPQYLQPGDVIESSISSPDGMVNLGTQNHRIEQANS